MSSTTLVIFGATGDLPARYIFPGIYHLLQLKRLPENFKVVAVSRRELKKGPIIDSLRAQVSDDSAMDAFEDLLTTATLDSGESDQYDVLRTVLSEIEEGPLEDVVRLLYLSVPPGAATDVLNAIDASGFMNDAPTRIIIEKPFGTDLASAIEFEDNIEAKFDADAVYRVDHYLAKAATQALQTVAGRDDVNGLSALNVERVEVGMREKLTVEGRVDFYEQTGALRDVLQNHVAECMAMALMQSPVDDTAEALHKARTTLLEDVMPIEPEDMADDVIRGQYEGYADDVDNADTLTETFVAVRLRIDTERWRGVPIVLVTGKALTEKQSYIHFYLKDSTKITIDLNDRGNDEISGYERVIYDALRGDRHHFLAHTEVLATWRIFDDILRSWQATPEKPQLYEPGGNGPALWV